MSDPADLLSAGIDTTVSSSPADWTPPAPESLDGAFPQLEIIALIGRGGMGAVYKARQTHLDRTVAVKLLSPERGADPAFAERFTREARALARLQHAHIVTLFDFGRAGPWLYLVMEYVEGANLRQLMATGRLSPSATLHLVAPLCDAMVHAHSQGVVHRDLKPENILIDGQGLPKIADFGLAKLRSSNGELTQTGDSLGTLHYMAPEQISGTGDVDHRADVYALGVVFYEMLTGNLPLGRCLPPSQSGSDPRLDEVVLKSLEREPSRRWQSASELRQAMVGAQTSSDAKSASFRAGRLVKSLQIALLAAAILVLPLLGYVTARSTAHSASVPLSGDPKAEPDRHATPGGATNEIRQTNVAFEVLEKRKASLEQRLKDLEAHAAQAQREADRVDGAVASAREQQDRLVADLGRLSQQRADLEVQVATAAQALADKAASPIAVTDGTAVAASQDQEQADRLAAELTLRLPPPLPSAPAHLELRYDRKGMTTIGHVVRADGSGEDMAPEPWPRDGVKVLVSAARIAVERRYVEIVATYQHAVDERQNIVRELVSKADELQRLDRSGRHSDLVNRLHRLAYDNQP